MALSRYESRETGFPENSTVTAYPFPVNSSACPKKVLALYFVARIETNQIDLCRQIAATVHHLVMHLRHRRVAMTLREDVASWRAEQKKPQQSWGRKRRAA